MFNFKPLCFNTCGEDKVRMRPGVGGKKGKRRKRGRECVGAHLQQCTSLLWDPEMPVDPASYFGSRRRWQRKLAWKQQLCDLGEACWWRREHQIVHRFVVRHTVRLSSIVKPWHELRHEGDIDMGTGIRRISIQVWYGHISTLMTGHKKIHAKMNLKLVTHRFWWSMTGLNKVYIQWRRGRRACHPERPRWVDRHFG